MIFDIENIILMFHDFWTNLLKLKQVNQKVSWEVNFFWQKSTFCWLYITALSSKVRSCSRIHTLTDDINIFLSLPGIKAAWRGLARFSMSTISSSSSWVRSNEAEWLEAMTWKTFGGGGVQGFLRGRWTSMGGEVQNCTGVVNLRPQTQPPADSGSSLLQELEAVVLPPELLTYSLKL